VESWTGREEEEEEEVMYLRYESRV